MSSWGALLRRGHLGTEADRATFRTLHTALLASPPLRQERAQVPERALGAGRVEPLAQGR